MESSDDIRFSLTVGGWEDPEKIDDLPHGFLDSHFKQELLEGTQQRLLLSVNLAKAGIVLEKTYNTIIPFQEIIKESSTLTPNQIKINELVTLLNERYRKYGPARPNVRIHLMYEADSGDVEIIDYTDLEAHHTLRNTTKENYKGLLEFGIF